MKIRRMLLVLLAIGVCQDALGARISLRSVKNHFPRTSRVVAEVAKIAAGAGLMGLSTLMFSGTRYETPWTYGSLWLTTMYAILGLPAQYRNVRTAAAMPVDQKKSASTTVGIEEFADHVQKKVEPLTAYLESGAGAAVFCKGVHLYGSGERVRLVKAIAAKAHAPLFELCGPELVNIIDGHELRDEERLARVDIAVHDVFNDAQKAVADARVRQAIVHIDLATMLHISALNTSSATGLAVLMSSSSQGSAVDRAISAVADELRNGARDGRITVVVSTEQQSDLNVHKRSCPELFAESINMNGGFADYVGVVPDAAQVLVDYIKHEDAYRKVGARVPRSVLMYGAPGNGKTFLAHTIASEAGVPFFFVSSPSMVSKWIGDSSKNISAKFQEAQNAAVEREVPYAFLFFDEFDAIAGARDKRAAGSGADEERNAIVDTLLTCIDTCDRVVVIAATNFKDSLDEAVTRFGRFSFKIEVTAPDETVRRGMIEKACAKVVYAGDKSLLVADLAERTKDLSAADLATVVNNAALEAGRQRADAVTLAHFCVALDNLRKEKKQKDLLPDGMYA